MSEPYIDIEKIVCMLNRMNALTNPNRIAIIELLLKKEIASVTEIQVQLNLERATTSNHLRILRDNNLVKAKKSGKNKFYSINHIALAEIITSISSCS